ncbi:hypothetical protein CAP31_09490 [Sulfuriferula sp. AH1]|uniref:hypothetical protein n=1 Tax=Sulfuriferula sp. AH1 TaxID=1985873 RepID=UPI000B3B52A7|nr:hypothetical protein [Sulfuriferula sp. AH1]ARU31885.1 hypothetical protein CAP31_09490 [Sulfuriferula sp. AH1]
MNASLLHDLQLPALKTLLARASRTQTDASGGIEAILCQHFGVTRQTDWPIGPITLLADGGDSGHHYWFRADPVHFRATRDQLMLVDSGAFNVSHAEAEQFAEAFNRHFQDEGYLLYPLRPDRWYLRVDATPELATHSINTVTGKHIDAYLPNGADALAWHRFYNEIQMLFFGLAINQAREARGELPINGLWCWGGGVMPKMQPITASKFLANDSDARALAFAAGVANDSLPRNAGKLDQSALLLLDALNGAAQYGDYIGWREAILQMEKDWFAPLLSQLKSGKLSSVNITTATEKHAVIWHTRRMDLLKLWRHARLVQLLSAPA